jgi:hypothetical protein
MGNYNTVKLLGDVEEKPISQVFDPVTGNFIPLEGTDSAMNTIPRTQAMSAAPKLSGRYKMMVYNAGTAPVYWGGSSSVTVDNGMPLAAGDYAIFGFYPSVPVAIFFVAAAADQSIRVVELK